MYRPNEQIALDIYKRYFLNRTDVIPVQNNERIFPVIADDKLDNILLSHFSDVETTTNEYVIDAIIPVKGKFKVGAYTPNKEGFTKWCCLDFDGHGHGFALKNPKEACTKVKKILSERGLKSYIERSAGGNGYHLWIFFSEPIQALVIRAILLNLIPKDILLEDDINHADVKLGRGIELFPKQDLLYGDRAVGTQVWLPYYHSGNNGGSLFYDDNYEPILLTSFDTNTLDLIKLIFDQMGGVNVLLPKPSEHIEVDANNVWVRWRREVLGSLNLESIYGQWLVGGTSGIGWLRCCDPWSPTGDRRPSAGVATGEGEAERGTFHSFITGQNLSVFDFLRRIGVVEDTHNSACRYLSNVTGIPIPPDPPNNNNNNGDGEGENDENLPNIITNNRQFREILQDSWLAVNRSNSPNPYLFNRSGMLVCIQKNDIIVQEEANIYGILGRVANWIKVNEDGIFSCLPVEKIARDFIYCDHPIREVLPKLEYITTIPVFNKFGSLVISNGYDKNSGVWFSPSDDIAGMPHISTKPTWQEVETAKQFILDDLFGDFPFVSSSDISHCLSALFLPFIRNFIDGPTPLHVVEAPTAGTGKGKLCNLISVIITGSVCESRSVPNTDDEIRKAITAELVKGKPIILLDNASEKKKLDSATLASVLTSTNWTDRILGETKMVSLPNGALWLLTANNPSFSMELARRCIRIRLDSKTDQPWRRKGFKHKYVEEWAKTHRANLVHAVLTIIQYWLSIGSPLIDNLLGSFERWSAIMGGILRSIKVDGFLSSLEELYETSDIEGLAWRTFILHWYTTYGSEEKTVKELLDLCESKGIMDEVIGDGTQRNKISRFKTSLRSVRDRVLLNCKIEMLNEGLSYKLVPLNEIIKENIIEPEIIVDNLFEE